MSGDMLPTVAEPVRRGPPGSFSATQIDNFDRCPRIWGWAKLDGIDGLPRIKYAVFGTGIACSTREISPGRDSL